MMPRVCVETSLDVESLNRTVEGRLNRSVEERLNRTIGFTVEEHSRGEPEGRKLRERGCDVPENVGYGAPTALDVSGLARACCSRNEPRTPERRTSQKRRLHTHVGWTRVGPVQDRAARACTPGAMREPDATRANKNGSTRAPQCAVQRSAPVTNILDGRERRSQKTERDVWFACFASRATRTVESRGGYRRPAPRVVHQLLRVHEMRRAHEIQTPSPSLPPCGIPVRMGT
jgi:hypothetical protein